MIPVTPNRHGTLFFSEFNPFCSKVLIEEQQKTWTYSVRPIQLRDDGIFTDFLIDVYRGESLESLALMVNELIFRSLENDPLGCYLIRDANEQLVGHLTLDPAKRDPSIFVSTDLKKHFWPLMSSLWVWTKCSFARMRLGGALVHETPLQEASLCLRLSSFDLFRKKVLETEGFCEENSSDEPPKNTLYHMNLSKIKQPTFYKISIKDLFSSPMKFPCEIFQTWNALRDCPQTLSLPSSGPFRDLSLVASSPMAPSAYANDSSKRNLIENGCRI